VFLPGLTSVMPRRHWCTRRNGERLWLILLSSSRSWRDCGSSRATSPSTLGMLATRVGARSRRSSKPAGATINSSYPLRPDMTVCHATTCVPDVERRRYAEPSAQD
jgi:hypothetical protein